MNLKYLFFHSVWVQSTLNLLIILWSIWSKRKELFCGSQLLALRLQALSALSSCAAHWALVSRVQIMLHSPHLSGMFILNSIIHNDVALN